MSIDQIVVLSIITLLSGFRGSSSVERSPDTIDHSSHSTKTIAAADPNYECDAGSARAGALERLGAADRDFRKADILDTVLTGDARTKFRSVSLR